MTWKRVATAAVLIPLVVVLVTRAATAWVALGMTLVILLALVEFFALGEAIGHRAFRVWTAACACLLVLAQYAQALEERHSLGGLNISRSAGRWPLPDLPEVLFLFLVGMAVAILATRRPLVEALPAAGISSSALLLLALPLSYAVRLHGVAQAGPFLLLFSLVIVWIGDTAAYFVGRTVGRHPLAPHLSPKKTWEGSAASLVAALLAGLAFRYRVNVEPGHLLGMAAAGNVAGQIGDLLESAYKRSAGVKDSGALLPGHGGVLDRIDALVLAFPVVWYYWLWIYSPRA